MRLVRWSPNERVDIPDITAMSFLSLGEFRRTVRALFSGDSGKYVIRGFAVEPESPASNRVRVRLDPSGAGVRGKAIGAENIAGSIDYGQVIGDRDSSFISEGQAQQILDFTGQPVGSYTVEMRFTYADGVNDNRAFINPATLAENVQAVDTRHVSGWEVRYVSGIVGTGNEWIKLAVVAWAGAAINSGDIGDARVLFFEGATPWENTAQNSATGIVEDFDRDEDRASVGFSDLRGTIRALQRQIQDIKGQSSAGMFNWFSRVFRPFDPDGDLASEKTKTLRSVDTVMYTVGDGVNTFGDFNGTSGLQDCLNHIAAISGANQPSRVEVVIHGSATAYTLATSVSIVPTSSQQMTLVLRAGVHTGKSGTGVGLFGRPKITMSNVSAAGFGLLMANDGNLELRDLDIQYSGTTAGGRHMFGAGGYIIAERCRILHALTPDVAAGFALYTANSRFSRITDCDVWGRICMYDEGSAPSTPADRYTTGVIERCRLDQAQIVLREPTGAGLNTDVAVGLVIRDCHITARNGIYTSTNGLIDGRSARYVLIDACTLEYGANQNCIDARTYSGAEPFSWRIRDCTFSVSVANGTHAVDGGAGGADGTGWAINIDSTSGDAQSMQVRGCRFFGNAIDAGGIRMHHVAAPVIDSCEWASCFASSGERYTAIELSADSANYDSRAQIDKCTMHKWATEFTRGIRLINVDGVTITSSTIRGDDDGVELTGRGSEDVALWLEEANNILVNGCQIMQWEPGGTVSRCVVNTTGGVDSLIITGCSFRENGNYSVDIDSGSNATIAVTINDNTFFANGNNNENGVHLDYGSGSGSICNNRFHFNADTRDAIFLEGNSASGRYIVMGNIARSGQFRFTGTATVRGYNEAGQDLNLFSGGYV